MAFRALVNIRVTDEGDEGPALNAPMSISSLPSTEVSGVFTAASGTLNGALTEALKKALHFVDGVTMVSGKEAHAA